MGLHRLLFALAGLLLTAGCAVEIDLGTTATPTPRPSATPSPAAGSPSQEGPPRPTIAPTPQPEPTATPPQPAGPPTSIRLELVAAGLQQPVGLTHAGDGSGRLFVVEKGGRIRIVRDGAVLPQPFLDIGDRVGSSGFEQGLLGLAFAPDYARSGFFYVNDTDPRGDTVVERYRASGDPDRADPTSGEVVLTLDQPFANHNGGQLAFGPDGYLWIGTGDGGSGGDPFGNAQNGQTLLGKMLRLDVTRGQPYAVPPDNPFVADPGVLDEIWALGLRNPWRYSFDRQTGDLYIGDVGQNAWEEVDFVPADSAGGLNFGWNIMEGRHCFLSQGCDAGGLVLPVAEYSLSGAHCSVIGGHVYRGQAFPQMQGVYLFADFCSGFLWSLTRPAGGGWAMTELARTGLNPASLGEDEEGEVYLVDMSGGGLYRLVPE